ncbi:hypothetical protein H072_11127 [Dactylellina haptotyla CBS 200.50]|uniref:Transmembrane protein n=1 Tax=Dactylellina haptotyla (strain CBS 200.50) TaxID=1284197 RepID=S7ZXH1_DACHA|nr:hypothetical protein H072_11127 [Dactylellina haptotyla CBS 200.50]
MMDLSKRAFDALAVAVTNSTTPGKEQPEPINVFAIILFMVTLLVAGACFILFDYTFQVVKILTIIEDLPSDYDLVSPAYGPVDGDSEPEDGAPPHYRDDVHPEEHHTGGPGVPKIAPGLYLGGSPDINGKYITSSFRTTLKYLRQEAGFWSAWRGFSVNIVYSVAASCVNGIFRSMFPFPFGKYIAGVLVMLVVSPLGLVHTHVVIAPPTKETWFGRLSRLPFKSIVHTLPAALLVAIFGQATYAFPDIMVKAFVPSRAFDDPPPEDDNPYQSMLTPLQCLAIYSVFLASHVFLFIPSMIIMYRVQASVYSSTEEAIIPFERLGPQSIIKAWKSYTWEGKKRLIRLYLKVMPVVWLAAFTVGTLLFFEMRWVMGAKGHVLDIILHTWLKNQFGKAP